MIFKNENTIACFALTVILIFSSLFSIGQHNRLTAREKAEGWELLFDGKTTKGWKSAFSEKFPAKGWLIKDGMMIVQSSDGGESTNGGDIITEKDFKNFELVIDFQLTRGATSGVKSFVNAHQPRPQNPRFDFGLEYQLLDDENHPDAKMGSNGNRTIGSLYDLIPANKNKPVRKTGEWNTARIVSRNNHTEHWLNGVKVVEYKRGGDVFLKLIEESKYKDLKGFGLNSEGRILLQDHGNRVAFRNIKIRSLDTPADKSEDFYPSRLGMVSYTYRNSFQKNIPATLDTIMNLKIRNLEFSNLFGKKAEEIKQLLDERGMRCTSFGVSMNDALTKTDEVALNAIKLGAKYVRVAYLPHDGPFTIKHTKKAVADFNSIGKKLREQYGLIFSYHNHGYEFANYENETLFDYMIKNTEPDYVSFELDILWTVFPGHDPVTFLEKYGPRFKLMHLKDLKKGVEGNSSGNTSQENDVALGTGQLNLEKILKAAKKAGVEYYYIEDESPKYNEQVPQSIEYLKRIDFIE